MAKTRSLIGHRVLHDSLWDHRLSVYTIGDPVGKRGGYHESLQAYETPHVPTPYRDLFAMMDFVEPSPRDVFMDLGCGKGRALFAASLYSLERAIGVEKRLDLWSLAQANLMRATGLRSPVEIERGDAVETDLDRGTIFYLYDPFGEAAAEKLFDRLAESLERVPRPARLAYRRPTWARHVSGLELVGDCAPELTIWKSQRED